MSFDAPVAIDTAACSIPNRTDARWDPNWGGGHRTVGKSGWKLRWAGFGAPTSYSIVTVSPQVGHTGPFSTRSRSDCCPVHPQTGHCIGLDPDTGHGYCTLPSQKAWRLHRPETRAHERVRRRFYDTVQPEATRSRRLDVWMPGSGPRASWLPQRCSSTSAGWHESQTDSRFWPLGLRRRVDGRTTDQRSASIRTTICSTWTNTPATATYSPTDCIAGRPRLSRISHIS